MAGYGIRPFPGTCCPECTCNNGKDTCDGCGHKHSECHRKEYTKTGEKIVIEKEVEFDLLKEFCIKKMGKERFEKRFNDLLGGPDDYFPFYNNPNKVILIIADELELVDINEDFEGFEWIGEHYCKKG